MSGLGRRLLQEVTSGSGSEPLGSIADQVRELTAAYGGNETRLSKDTGFHRSTLWRWKTGKTKPRKSTLGRVAELVRASRVDPGRPTDKSIALDVTEFRSGRRDGSERHLTGDRIGLRPGTMARVVEAYKATGDPEVMARVFVDGVTVGFYKSALSAGLDPAPSGPVDAPGGGQAGRGGGAGDEDEDDDGDEEDAVWDLYEDYVDDLRGEEAHDEYPDGGSYGFDVA